jgi:dTDP-4-dehydrorhamnose reductase
MFKMNVLVLGGTGMLGHKIFQHLKECVPDAWCTVRGDADEAETLASGLFAKGNVIGNVDAADLQSLERLLSECRPKVIVNCVGIIKQRTEGKEAIPNIEINALLPHRLAALSAIWQGRLIHFSTDCVFSGRRGSYSEEDQPDAEDFYGKAKFLGEVTAPNSLTLRTSIIGRELSQFKSLLEWLLQQNHRKIMGYTRAFYSGVTTNYMAGLVAKIIKEQPSLCGLYQVTSATISKYDLLCLVRDAYEMDVEIERDDKFLCDRSMIGEKFVKATGYRTPSWPELVAQLRHDPTPYDQWRRIGEQQGK